MASSASDDEDIALGSMFEEPEGYLPPPPEDKVELFARRPENVDVGAPADVKVRLLGTHPLWGHYLWNAAKVFAHFLDEHKEIVRGKTVLELGAAGALPSLVAALNGAKRVVITDYPDADLVGNIRQCVALNMPDRLADRSVIVDGYKWGYDIERIGALSGTADGTFDVLILCDLVFNHSEHPGLLKSVAQLLARPAGVAYVFFSHHRPHLAAKDMEFIDRARDELGLCVCRIAEVFTGVMFELDSYDDYDSEDDYDSDDDLVIETHDFLGNTEDWGENGGDFTKQYNKMRQQAQLQAHLGGARRPAQAGTRGGPTDAAAGGHSKPSINGSVTLKSVDLSKYASRIKLDELTAGGPGGGGSAPGLAGSRKAQGANATQRKDKSDRATTEQVLDPRTRIILFKLLNQGVIYEINGCISTGKEANVYHAVTESGEHRAIKIYKTSILTFKDRDRYVTGERRFRHGYSRHNPRKMVRLWAEKEMRNLKRLYAAGIASPNPIILRQHVLVMDFLGSSDGWAYPRLKDA
ncbi:Serine/threonine-protein kinase rio1, partial [Coemansia nantahalensis]